jgi:hypothetical protein
MSCSKFISRDFSNPSIKIKQIHGAKLPSATSSPIATYLIFLAQQHINLPTEQYLMFFASILGRRAEFMQMRLKTKQRTHISLPVISAETENFALQVK